MLYLKIPINQWIFMTKEVIKHSKEERKKPTLTPKEKKAKKAEKKLSKNSKP
jgi:hypothetical protein